jgi:VCBS repeat-containing protein
MGDVVISGVIAEDETLTASNTLTDVDGLGTISYEWFAGSTSVGTGATLTLTQAEVGEIITVVASYTDGNGTAESVASAPTVPVANVNDAPMGGVTVDGTRTEDETLTANTSALSDEDGLGSFSYQWTRDGVDISGATSDSYILGDDDVGAVVEVTVSYTDGEGTSESVSSMGGSATVNVNDAPMGDVVISGVIAEDETLTADISAVTDADGLSSASFSYDWMRDGVSIGAADAATYTLSDEDVGAVISVQVSFVDDNGTSETLVSADTVAVANVNDAPSGNVTIIGMETEDQTLFADSSTITDIDNGSASSGVVIDTYQWLRDGVAITGATTASYTLGDDDVGTEISVTVTYTDGGGTLETLTSDATDPVANIDDAAVVSGDFSGAVTEGDIGDAPVTATGTIVITDIDINDNPTFPDVTSTVGDNGFGSFELSNNGDWTYTLDQSAVQNLAAGATASDTITFTADDGTMQEVTVVITGTADSSFVTGTTAATRAEGELGDGDITASGTLTITNVDDGSNPTFPDAGPATGTSGFGTFSITGGVWSYVATQAAVNDLNDGETVADTFTFTADDGTTQIVAVTITGANNNLVGTAAGETLVGSGGIDTILGLAGDDTLEGGADDDVLDGGEGTGDTVVLSGDYADYTLTFANGVITLLDNVGTDGTDQITNTEFLQFADQLIEVATLGLGEINGTPGNDVLTGTANDDIINGLSGNDSVFAGAGDDVVNGGSGNDYLRGEAGQDTLNGGFGVDFLRGGADADILNGGAGQDWADYTTSNAAVTVNLGTNTGLGGDAQGDTYILVERVYGSRFDDNITGDGGVNYLRGFRGDDQLFGEGGTDFLQGGLGADALDGGAGSDWAYYVSSSAGLTIDLGNVSNNTGEAAGDTYTSIENALGSRFDDIISGDAGNNFLRGLQGDDVLTGGDGVDFVRGDQGADVLDGGNGVDWAYYASSSAGINVDLAANTATGGDAQGDTFISVERVYGSGHDDIINGDAGANYLRGSFGDDVLSGGDGNDFLQGDGGADMLDGGAGSDWAYYASATAGLTIDLGNASNNTGEAIGDSYLSIENIVGSRHDDNIMGDSGNNYLRGFLGDDIINGGAGDDILRGEAGADTFVFEVGTGNDTVIDYNDAEDLLDFTSFGVADAMQNAMQVGDDVVFTFGTDTITIEDAVLADLADNLV